MEIKINASGRGLLKIIIFFIVFIFLFSLNDYHFVIYHTVVEFFSIIVAFILFMVAWNLKDLTENQAFVSLGIAYFFIATINFFHTIFYVGFFRFLSKNDFATEFWIAARYMETMSLLGFVLLLKWKRKINHFKLMIFMFLLTTLIFLSILVWKIFPLCFIEGKGLTPFKIYSEYAISIVLIFTAVLFYQIKHQLDKKIYFLMTGAILLTVISELFFTFYIDRYDISNQLGHMFKFISFFLVYLSFIYEGLRKPYLIVYNDLIKREEELKELNSAKDKFFSIIAHDLKTPFSGLINLSKLFKEQFDTIDDDEKKEYADLIYSASLDSYNLLENLLTWSRSQTGRIVPNITAVDIHELIGSSIYFISTRALQKRIKINKQFYHEKILAECDYNMVHTVIRNLLSNAVKFSPFDSSVEIITSKDHGECVVSVKDFGIGMNEKEKSLIFRIDENFIRKGTDNEKGTGLGLIICKEFIEKNRGKMDVKSVKGHGSEFLFTLPLV